MAPQDEPSAESGPISSEEYPGDLALVERTARSLAVHSETPNLACLGEFTELERLMAREIPPRIIEPALAAMPRLRDLNIFGTRMESFAPLADLPLRRLNLTWAHKADSIAPLARLDQLETLVIGDMKRVSDFSPLGALSSLVALHIETGMWSDQKVDSLAFLRRLPQLREFRMHYLKLGDGDLSPICALKNLERLSLPTKYPVREYARLSVCLPRTECAEFSTHVTYRVATLAAEGDPDATGGLTHAEHGLLVGKPSTAIVIGEPRADRLIAKRSELFERWREHYRSVPDPAADRRETLD